MRITSDRFENETYRCYGCSEDIKTEDVNDQTWECDVCNGKIKIDIGRTQGGDLVRLRPNEVTEHDHVFDRHTKEFHVVKGSTRNNNGMYNIGVAGHGSVKVAEDEFVDCMWRDQ
ncbi:hypothetical protein [Bacillus cereus]